MSRLAARRRWLMTGPWPHPKTGIFYYRKATPPDIVADRGRLAEFGVRVTREVQRSLGTKDRKPAERRYVEVSTKVEAEWDRWRALLRDGPQPLSPRQQIALAAEHAKAFLSAHEEDPFSAPPGVAIIGAHVGLLRFLVKATSCSYKAVLRKPWKPRACGDADRFQSSLAAPFSRPRGDSLHQFYGMRTFRQVGWQTPRVRAFAVTTRSGAAGLIPAISRICHLTARPG